MRRAAYPSGLDLHLIVDNDAPYKAVRGERFLKPNRRFKIHVIPARPSGLNLGEAVVRRITPHGGPLGPLCQCRGPGSGH
jgi:hypothetical protein